MTKPRVIALAALAALGLATVPDAPAADYPSRAIEVVVPYAPGGGTDNLMRTITGIMDENRLSPVPLNVVNRAGGSGAVGYNYLVGKKGNDHVVAGATPTIVSGKIEGRIPGDHRDGMTILAIVAVDELTLAVRSDSKYQTIQQFLEAARSQPNTLSVGGTSTNAEDHIFTYLMERATGIKVKYVPFNSGGEVTAALLGGHIDAAVENPNEVQAQIEAGKARFLAVAAEKRMPDAAQVPTFKELGYDVLWDQMRGVVGPADMSPEAVRWWQDALLRVTETERWQKGYIEKNLLTPVFMTGEEASAYLDQVREKYRKALTDMGAVKP
ncbi:MAG TPA: tripartite tricarboxylate transporter substrate binding protein [Thermodesulfobacteriota bacterium]